MYEVSDKVGNSFFTDSYELAVKVVKEVETPFINIVKLNKRVKIAKEHIVKTYADFCVYFY